MTLTVLVIEDDNSKYGRVHTALIDSGVLPENVEHAITASDGVQRMTGRKFDLLILDVNVPRRLGEAPQRGAGLLVLEELGRNQACFKPMYIVGLTAYEDIIAEFGPTFDEQLWSLVHYTQSSDRWIAQLALKLRYIAASKRSENFSDGVTYGLDLAIITALDSPELAAVHRLDYDWQPLRFKHDDARYSLGALQVGSLSKSVISVSATRMGMPTSAVLASKVIHQFRPRYLAMVGICAGRSEKVKIGDVVVAEPTWDWGSGKITSVKKQPKFLPAPHQLDLDVDVLSSLKSLSQDRPALAALRDRAVGKRPPFELNVHCGPMVSGAAVVANKATFDQLLEQHRGILALDMEAYGVAAAARGSARPRPTAIIVKGVCDYADQDKDDDYQEYAANVAALFLDAAAKTILGT